MLDAVGGGGGSPQYNTTPVAETKPDPKPEDNPEPKSAPPAVAEHTVSQNENVWTIVHENSAPMTMDQFYELNPQFAPGKQNGKLEHPNPGNDPDFIVPGQKLNLLADGPGANTLNYVNKAISADKSLTALNGQPFAHKPMEPGGTSQWQDAKTYSEDMWRKAESAADYELRLAYQQGGQAELDRRLKSMQDYAPDNEEFGKHLTGAAERIATESPAQSGPAITKYEDSENVVQFTTELQKRWDTLTPAQKTDPAAFTNVYRGLVAENDADKNTDVDDPSQNRGLRTAGLKFELDLKPELKPEKEKMLIDEYLGTDAATWQLAANDETISHAISGSLTVGNREETLQKLKGLLTPDQLAQVTAYTPPVTPWSPPQLDLSHPLSPIPSSPS